MESEDPTLVPTELRGEQTEAAAAATSPGGREATLPGGAASSSPGLRLPRRGERIGHFIVQRKLGAGAMGVVLLAVDEELDRQVAIKLLTAGLHGPVAQARLVREARSGARLQHPNVVAVHQVGTHEDQVYLVMEYVAGGTLTQWLRARERDWRQIVEVFVQVGRGLAAAHAAGMVHRDFKPDNVLIDDSGRPRVSDFGLVDISGDASDLSATARELGDERLTQTGAIMGTPAYMAPEQMGNVDVDARSDQYAFCIALYEALWGERPFRGDTLAALIGARAQGATEPPRSKVPHRIRAAVMRGLQYEADDRHESMEALLRRLEPPRSTRTAALLLGTTLGAVTLSAVLYETSRERAFECPPASEVLGPAWDAQTRATAAQAFAATGRTGADRIWERTAADLDARREALTSALDAACTDAGAGDDSHGSFGQRTACLSGHGHELTRVGQAIAAIDASTIDGAQIVAREVAMGGVCDDPTRLAVEAIDIAPEHAELHREVVHLELLGAGDRHAEVIRVAPELVTRLREQDVPALLARALLVEARARTFSQDYSAIAMLREVMKLAASINDNALEAEAGAVLVEFDTAINRDHAESLALVSSLAAAAERSGNRRARVLAAFARAMGLLVQDTAHEASIAVWTEAIEEAESEQLARPDELARAYFFRAALEDASGSDGTADYEHAQRLLEDWLGDHPALAQLLFTRGMGVLWSRFDRFDQARPLFERALQIWETTVGPNARVTLGALVQLGRAQLLLDDPEGAAKIHADALQRCDVGGACDPAFVTVIIENLAWEELLVGRTAAAIEHYERAIETVQLPTGKARVVKALAEAELRDGRYDDAVKHYEGLREDAVARFSPKSIEVIDATNLLGHARRLGGDCDGARTEYRRALRVHGDLALPPDAMTREALIGLGRCELTEGKWESARESLDAAQALRDETHPDSDDERPSYLLAELDLARAILAEHDGQHDEARACAEAARTHLEGDGMPHDAWSREVEAWLAANGGS